jgi:hypothetical protein
LSEGNCTFWGEDIPNGVLGCHCLVASQYNVLIQRRKAIIDKIPDLEFWLLTDEETMELMKIQHELWKIEREEEEATCDRARQRKP